MFGGTRRKATRAATEAVQPFVRTLEVTGGLPRGFWNDSYVLGFLGGCIGIFAKMATQGRVSGEDMGRVLIDVFQAISDQSGVELAKRLVALQQSGDQDLLLGSKNADKAISVAYGFPDYDADPDVLEAKRRSTSLGPAMGSIAGHSTENANVAAMLQQILFYDRVRDRLGEGDDQV